MEQDQSPEEFLARAVKSLSETFKARNINAVVVQGDTTTALAGALAGFHLKLPVAHVEAGLRTGDMSSPFPEEMNRTLIGKLASLHFCPTKRAAENLKLEGVSQGVHITGNTVVDSALWCREQIETGKLSVPSDLAPTNPFILVTCHRRENFDQPLERLCESLSKVSESIENLQILFPVHLNPNIKSPVEALLSKAENINLLPPLSYPEMIHLIDKSKLIITDSGGLQEEAPSFGTPVIVTRVSTERPEAIEAGVAKLVSLSQENDLVDEIAKSLEITKAQAPTNPFGDGKASEKISTIIKEIWPRL